MIQIVSKFCHITGAAESKQGGRKENQDDMGFLDTPLGFLLVVCDGMGGGPGGKTASGLVKRYILNFFATADARTPRETAMRQAVAGAEKVIENAIRQQPQLAGMGSTLVAILISDECATVAHLGDSRCYKIRGNKMCFRTTDHSLVSELVANNTMTEEEARTSKQSNIITRALGSTNNHEPQIDIVPYMAGDRFLLCTDGVWGIMPHRDLMQRLASQGDTGNTVYMLSQEIDSIGFSKGGKHDNHTMAMVEMKSNSTLQEKMSRQTRNVITAGAAILAISLILNIASLFGKCSGTDSDTVKQLKEEVAALSDYKLKYEAAQAVMNQGQMESLEESIRLKTQVDSLCRVIERMQDERDIKLKKESTNSNNDKVNTTPDKKVSTAANAVIINNVIKKLKEAKNYKDKNSATSVKTKTAALNAALSYLSDLNDKTNKKYNNIIKPLYDKIKGKRVITYVDKDVNNFYVSTYAASKELDKLIKEAEQLKSKIK